MKTVTPSTKIRTMHAKVMTIQMQKVKKGNKEEKKKKIGRKEGNRNRQVSPGWGRIKQNGIKSPRIIMFIYRVKYTRFHDDSYLPFASAHLGHHV